MTNIKRNKTVARLIIVVGTLVAGIGIWLAVNQVPLSTSSAATAAPAASVPNISFSTTDTFLSQPSFQTNPAPSQPVQSQPVASARLRTRAS